MRGVFDARQVAQLLRPINPLRVKKDGKSHDHLSQQDVTAHLIRVFGFGNFDTEVKEVECLFEHNRLNSDGKPSQRWDVGYRALVRLSIRDASRELVCVYENGATATAQNQTLGDAHDLAYKSAISLSLKRCAINLGDQFGLSLYNKGQLGALVMDTLVKPDDDAPADQEDMQEGVEEQVGDPDDDLTGDDADTGEPEGLGSVIGKRA